LNVVNSESEGPSASNSLESSHTEPATDEPMQVVAEPDSEIKRSTAKVTEATDSNNVIDKGITGKIQPATLVQLRKLGFKLIPLSMDHGVVISWTLVYEDSNFWSDEKLVAESWKFKNVATVFGKTHLKDLEGRDLYLNDLDGDSEPVYNILTTPIDEISDSRLKSKLQELCFKFGLDMTTGNVSLFDCLKAITVVVKTRKPYGFQAFWLSHTQHDHIGTKDCKSGHEFEIKTDKSLGHATLPPSTHRNDKTVTYSYIGRTDKIETIDELYSLLIALLKECLASDPTNANDTDKDDDSSKRDEQSTATLYDLSKDMVQTTVAFFTPFYIVSHRHDFALCFSGAAWYAKISEHSASKILSQIAVNTNDNEIQSRLNTLHATYEKATKGELITGGPTLADLISAIKGCELEEARRVVARIQSFWHDDIQLQRKRKQCVRNTKELISVSEATRLLEGPVNVTGKIVGMNVVQPMISRLHLQCNQCSASPLPIDFTSKPVWRSPIKEHSRSYFCDCKGNTLTITDYEYIASLEIQIQDLEKVNNIEQLTTILFEQDTEGIQFNDIVILKGNLHVVRKYDNPSNRLQSILFVKSIEKQSKDEEIKNTQTDIEEFKQFALNFGKHDDEDKKKEGSIIHGLASITAPSTIGNELAKKALLIVAVNAGLPNNPTRLPKRIRSHVGLIGDPGQAKTQLLHQIGQLVPGSRVESMQSGTPISMTVYIDKEENGQRTYRPGPVVLATDAILGLNEFGQMKNIEDNKYFTDAAEEGSFTVTKHGFNFHVTAHPSFVWTANPISGRWTNPDVIDAAEFPIIAQWGDRMDFIIPFIERTDETSIRKYTKQRRGLVNKLGNFASTTLWLKKYLLYARSLKPDLPENVRIMLEDYLVAIAKHGVRGLPRKLEALERTAIGFAKLKLKDSVDEEDASDTIDLFNEMLKFYKQDVTSPRDLTFLQCLNVLEKTSPQKWVLDDLIQETCSKNPSIDLYIGEVKKSQYNYKIKALKPLLNKHPNVHRSNENPTTYAWFNKDDQIQTDKREKQGTYNNHLEESLDVTDVTESQKKEDEIKNSVNVTGTIVGATSAVTSAIDFTSGTTAKSILKDDKEQGCTNKLASDASDASDDSSGTITDNKNIEKISLRYPSAAHILTNNDVEDVENCSSSSGGESV
jgi:replicative DNA helicase Mcm